MNKIFFSKKKILLNMSRWESGAAGTRIMSRSDWHAPGITVSDGVRSQMSLRGHVLYIQLGLEQRERLVQLQKVLVASLNGPVELAVGDVDNVEVGVKKMNEGGGLLLVADDLRMNGHCGQEE
jgi:hypothetical protein